MKEGFNIKSSMKIQFDSKKEVDTIIDVLTPDNIRIISKLIKKISK